MTSVEVSPPWTAGQPPSGLDRDCRAASAWATRGSAGWPRDFMARSASAVSSASLAKSPPAPNPPSPFCAARIVARRSCRCAAGSDVVAIATPARDCESRLSGRTACSQPRPRRNPGPVAPARKRARRAAAVSRTRVSAESAHTPSNPCAACNHAAARSRSGTAERAAAGSLARAVSAHATPRVSAKKWTPKARRIRSTASSSSGAGSEPGRARKTKPTRNSFCDVRQSGRRGPMAAVNCSMVTRSGVAESWSPSRTIPWRSTLSFRRSVSAGTLSGGRKPIR